MRTGVAYMGHHNPKHLKTDLIEMKELALDDLFVCLQENDFLHFPGKVAFTPQIAKEVGIRPIAVFWGAFNLFGGGRSSQFLLENPDCFQVASDGGHRSAGCYVNPKVTDRVQEMIDIIAQRGYEAYFVDEPTPLRDCFCLSCRNQFEAWYGSPLHLAEPAQQEVFRQRCVVDYIRKIADYCKANHPSLETICCLMPVDMAMWEAAAEIESLDNIGTDVYWVNRDNDLEEMKPLLDDMAAIAWRHNKVHHEWLECWNTRNGHEPRVLQTGEILVREQPDALYVWAWEGQVGTKETCDNPQLAWAQALKVLAMAKRGGEG